MCTQPRGGWPRLLWPRAAWCTPPKADITAGGRQPPDRTARGCGLTIRTDDARGKLLPAERDRAATEHGARRTPRTAVFYVQGERAERGASGGAACLVEGSAWRGCAVEARLGLTDGLGCL